MGNKDLHNKQDQEPEEIIKGGLKFQTKKLGTDKAALWAKIKENTQEQTPIRSIQSRRRWLYYTAAVASIALLVVFLFNQNRMEQYAVPMAGKENFSLPDASQVVLNADSKIRFNEDKWEIDRTLNLEGEAFFDVEKGSTFTVNTPQGTVAVLGTEFNVFARGSTFRVTCQEGRIAVTSQNGLSKIITAGQGLELVDGQLQNFQMTTEKAAPWVDGIFDFENQPLSEIIAEIERQYAVQIKAPNAIQSELFTMRFSNADSLDEALEDIIYQFRLDINQTDDLVRLTSKK